LFFPVVVGLVLIFAEYVYLSPPEKKFKKKIFGGKIDYVQLLFAFILPLLLYSVAFAGFFLILKRPRVAIVPIADWLVVYFAFVCAVFAATGSGIHLVAKAVSWTLEDKKGTATYEMNRFFHGRLSHDLIYISVLLLFFFLMIGEVNHPLIKICPGYFCWLLIGLGLVTGGLAMVLLVWLSDFGDVSLKLFAFLSISMLFLAAIFAFNFSLEFNQLPFSLFLLSSAVASTGMALFLSLPKFRRRVVKKLNSHLAGY